MAQLNGKQTKAKFIQGGDQPGEKSGVRPASYDLHVGRVIIDGEVFHKPTSVAPQQTFVIISRERVCVSDEYVGYAMPKTSLCNEGILVLNTGLIDPGYEGLISTTAINFDKDPREIRIGDPFLRLVFHDLAPGADPAPKAAPHRDDDYVAERRADSKRYPNTFLDVPGQVERLMNDVTERVVERERNLLLGNLARINVHYALWSIGVATVIGILAIVLSIVFSGKSSGAPVQVLPIAPAAGANTKTDSETLLLVRELDRIETRLDQIQAQVNRLK